MQIFEDINKIQKNINTVLTLGTFDGIHLGHQEIIKELINRSVKNDFRNVVITFYPHPRTVVTNSFDIKLLTTKDEKQKIFENLGVQNLLTINFTKEFASLSPEEFINQYLIDSVGVSEIILGHDHHFGKGRGGNAQLLMQISKERGFSVKIIEPFYVDNEIVSSTKIRNALLTGDVKKANKMLGRNYSFTGTVVSGDKRGRELGYPTANINLSSPDKLLPAIGVYAVYVFVGGEKHKGLLSIGNRPTFYNDGEVVTEVYLYEFNREIYGETLTVELLERLRGEEKFNSADDLVEQMNKDKNDGQKIFNILNN